MAQNDNNATNYVEPKEQVNDFIDVEWNPLDEPVNDKPYASSGITVSEEEMTKPIAEPKFGAPPLRKPAQATDEKKGKDSEGKPKQEPFNRDFSNLSKKETEVSAEHSAKMLLNGYEWLHSMANQFIPISEKKLNRLQADGEINLNAMIPYEYGKEMRAGDFFQQYNQQVSQIFVVSDEFKEEFVPLCTKVLAKRGIGMTDEQRLAYMVGQDIATKAIMGFQIKKGQKNMIDSIKENTAAMKENMAAMKEMEELNLKKQQQQQQEQEYRERKESDPKLTVVKRGRPTKSSYRGK